MKLAIVTGCPNGMVTSVLCARLLDAAAQRQGWSTSVEVHDPKHPERQLSAATLDEAEWVLLVSSTPLDMRRFIGKRVFQSTPAQAIACCTRGNCSRVSPTPSPTASTISVAVMPCLMRAAASI